MTGGSISGVGGAVGGAAMSGCMAPGGAAYFGGLNGALGSTDMSGQNGLSPVKMQQLTDLLNGFSSAEILIALMMMSAAGRKDKDDEGGGGGAAMALLAGMAIGQQLQQGNAGMIGDFGNLACGGSPGATFSALA